MNYIREIIDSDKLVGLFNIPEEFRHRTVEVLIVPVEDKKNGIEKMRGKLKKYAKPELIEKESEAWEMAVKEKYEHR